MNVENELKRILDLVSPIKADWSDESLYDAPFTGAKLQFDAENLVYLVLELKSCFGVEFDSSDFDDFKFNSYNSVLSILKNKLQEKN